MLSMTCMILTTCLITSVFLCTKVTAKLSGALALIVSQTLRDDLDLEASPDTLARSMSTSLLEHVAYSNYSTHNLMD